MNPQYHLHLLSYLHLLSKKSKVSESYSSGTGVPVGIWRQKTAALHQLKQILKVGHAIKLFDGESHWKEMMGRPG